MYASPSAHGESAGRHTLVGFGLIALLVIATAGLMTLPAFSQASDRDQDGLPDHAEILLGTYLRNVADSDGDGLTDGEEDLNKNGRLDANETHPALKDTDGDGINDGIESTIGTLKVNGVAYQVPNKDVDGDSVPNARDRDSDGDGISDQQEMLPAGHYPGFPNVQSNPYLKDTDGDKLVDAAELAWCTNPNGKDYDLDGWEDGFEVQLGGNPHDADTDGDTIRDGVGSDGVLVLDTEGRQVAADSDGDGAINALDRDSDNDGLDDAQELSVGANPVEFDTDGDGYPDGYEYHLKARGFDPLLKTKPAVGKDAAHPGDTDGDGLPDGIEIAWWKTDPRSDDSDGDGLKDLAEGQRSNGLPEDTDGDGLVNALDRDSDNDGVPDSEEKATHPYRPDSDNDGLSDGAEINLFKTIPNRPDTDGDDLLDGEELRVFKTDPVNSDTDGDGVWDGDERLGRDLRLNHDDARKVAINGVQVVVPSDDVDGDGLRNWIDDDSDNDGVSDRDELSGQTYKYSVEGTWFGPGAPSNPGLRTNPFVRDTDGDGLWDSYEARVSYTNPASGDTDDDTLSDAWELGFGRPTGGEGVMPDAAVGPVGFVTDPHLRNTDGDFVNDADELSANWKTNPINPDSDGDGIKDGETLIITYRLAGTSGTQTSSFVENGDDLDNDGKSNVLDANSSINFKNTVSNNFRDRSKLLYREWVAVAHPQWLQGSPLNPGTRDSDGDHYLDTDEILAGSDPLDAGDFKHADLNDEDPDQDGLYNLEESVLNTSAQGESGMDSDGDGLLDGRELDPEGIDENHDGITYWAAHGGVAAQKVATHPRDLDSDGDALSDFAELGSGTDPLWRDTDGDQLPDREAHPRSADYDGDGLLDQEELSGRSWYAPSGIALHPTTDPALPDTDGDDTSAMWTADGRMHDGREVFAWQTDPARAEFDADDDGLMDNEEVYDRNLSEQWRYSTNPQVADTDHDGLRDGPEQTAPRGTLANDRDTDGDYLIDGYEVNRSYSASGHTYAQLPKGLKADSNDSDENGIKDCAEGALGIWARMAANKAVNQDVDEPDDDADGLNDGAEAPGDGTSLEALSFQTRGSYKADPGSRDSDGDLIGDAAESLADADLDGGVNALDADSDNDWLPDGGAAENYSGDVDGDEIPNALDGDTHDNDGLLDPLEAVLFEAELANVTPDYDHDTLPDGSEYYHWFFNPSLLRTNPRDSDTDRDGLADAVELRMNPRVSDTNRDGLADAVEPTNSDPLLWDSDHDGLDDGVEDWNLDGIRQAEVETNPRLKDTDGDGLEDGVENVKVDATHHHYGNPAYDQAFDHANALDKDTDDDGVWDGKERAGFSGSLSDAELPDSDADGLPDGEEYRIGTDPLNIDSDNDRVSDGADAHPLNWAKGGADLDLVIAEQKVRLGMKLLDQSKPVLSGDTEFALHNTTSQVNPDPSDGPSALESIDHYYLVASDFVWSAQAPGHTVPDPACKPVLAGGWLIESKDGSVPPCGSLESGTRSYTATFTTPAATLPGIYRGTVYFVASASSGVACASATDAVATMTPYASVALEVEVPARYDLDVWNSDGTPIWGVADNKMRLTGLPQHAGTLTGTFQVANPNNDPNAPRFNCMASSDNNWDADIQGNARIGRVGFRFVSSTTFGVAELGPGGVLTFAPAYVADFDLGERSEVVVQLNTEALGACGEAGRISGSVVAYHDVDANGKYDVGRDTDFDSFALEISLVSPDLDIADNQGSLVGNKLERRVDLSKALENWTFRASAVCDPAANGLLDAFDGPGCEDWTGLYLYDPHSKVETAVQVSGAPCAEPSAPVSSFVVYKYDPVRQVYDQSKFFRVNVWSCQDNRAECGSTDELTLKVDPSVLTTGMPDGLYRPFWGMDATASLHNGYVVLSTRGAGTSQARPSSGYPVIYRGGDVNSSTGGFFDRFEVALELANPPCAPAIATGRLQLPPVSPGHSSQGTTTVRGCAQPLVGLSISVSALVGPAGRDRITDAVATLDATALPVDGMTTARVTVSGADHLAGTYTGTATVVSANGHSSTIDVEVTVNGQPAFEILGPAEVALVNEDFRKVVIRNTGNTDIPLTPSVPEEIPFVTVAPSQLQLGWHQEQEITVTANPEVGQRAGSYPGEILFSASGAPERALRISATVTSRPKLAAQVSSVTAERGGRARVVLGISSTGNVGMENVSVRLGDLVPSLAGGRPIAGPPDSRSLGTLALGQSGTAEFDVHLDAGAFCGDYTATARITGQAEFQGEAYETTTPVSIVVTGCERRPMAFSRNPVRFSQSRSVDIAFATGGVVTAKVYNMHGLLVRELANRVSLSGGTLAWDFKNDKGAMVASGMYLVVAQIDGKEFREKLLFVK